MKKSKLVILVLLCALQYIYGIEYTFNFSISDFHIERTDSGVYVLPLRNEYALLEDTTLPCLPYYYACIALPPDTRVSAMSYHNSNEQIVEDVQRVRNNLLIVPTSSLDSIVNSPSNRTATTYQGHCYPTENVSLIYEEIYGNNKYVTFQLCPFEYIYDSALVFINQIQLTLETSTLPFSIQGSRSNSMAKRLLFNPDDYLVLSNLDELNPDSIIDYVIITSNYLKEAFLPLKHWKTIKGVKTKIITTEEIYATYTATTPQLKIKQCLLDYYNNHNTKWVLLGGDDTIVPTIGCYGQVNGSTIDNNIPCDLFYACFSGRFDWNANGNNLIGELTDSVVLIPDVYVSRLPIRIASQATNYIQKLLRYEQTPPVVDYAKRMLLCGTYLWNYYSNGQSDAHMKSELFYNTHIQPYWDGTKYKFYDTGTDFGGNTYDLIPTNINAQLNTGYHFVHYASHGGPTFWETEIDDSTYDYTTTYAVQLTNRNAPSVIATMACNTNRFDGEEDPCLSEALLRYSSGAISYFGSSRYGWGNANPNMQYISLGPSFQYDGLFFRTLFRDSIFHFAETTFIAKYLLKSQSLRNNAFRWLQFSINPMGDPELPLYTNNPTPFSNVSITKNGNTVYVNTNGVDNCTITLTSANDYGETYFNRQLNVSSSIFYDVPTAFYAVITKHNYIPYIYSCTLPTVYLQNEEYSSGISIDNANVVLAGEAVTPVKPQGNVIIHSGGELKITNASNVELHSGFEVKLGGKLEIQ